MRRLMYSFVVLVLDFLIAHLFFAYICTKKEQITKICPFYPYKVFFYEVFFVL